MTHYFSKPDLIAQNRRDITFRFLGILSSFVVDDGIFSKDKADFGSLLLVETVLNRHSNGLVLDLGAGYGLMSILLKQHQNQFEVTGLEINSRALDCAIQSSHKQNLDILFEEKDVTENFEGHYDIIVTNPPIRAGKKVVERFIQQGALHLKENGSFYFVIRRQQGVASFVKYAQTQFKHCERCVLKKGYEVWIAKYPLT